MKIAELLKLFNSRTCQLVLGAGAVNLAGLKTITIRNLAVTQRSLSLVAGIVPEVSYIHVNCHLVFECKPNQQVFTCTLKYTFHIDADMPRDAILSPDPVPPALLPRSLRQAGGHPREEPRLGSQGLQ